MDCNTRKKDKDIDEVEPKLEELKKTLRMQFDQEKTEMRKKLR